MQCNVTKFDTFIVNEYYHQCYLFQFWNLRYYPNLSTQNM